MKMSLVFMTMLFAVGAQAGSAMIRATHREGHQAIISSNDFRGIRSGDILEIRRNCLFEVTRVAMDRALVSTKYCNNPNIVKPGFPFRFQKKIAAFQPTAPSVKITAVAKPQKSPMMPSNLNSAPESYAARLQRPSVIQTAPAPAPVPQPIIQKHETVVQPVIIREVRPEPTPRETIVAPAPERIVPPFVTRGIRVGFAKEFLNYDLFSIDQEVIDKTHYTGKFEQNAGFSLGVASIGYQKPGITAQFVYNDFKLDDGGFETYRAEVNGAIGVLPWAYLYLGINNNWSTLEGARDPMMGYQGGVGLQFTPNLGINIGYLKIMNRGSLPESKFTPGADPLLRRSVQVEASGVDVILHGTF